MENRSSIIEVFQKIWWELKRKNRLLIYVGREKSVYWDGRTKNGKLVSTGIYFYQLETDQSSETRKKVILK